LFGSTCLPCTSDLLRDCFCVAALEAALCFLNTVAPPVCGMLLSFSVAVGLVIAFAEECPGHVESASPRRCAHSHLFAFFATTAVQDLQRVYRFICVATKQQI